MKLRITTLTENTVAHGDLLAEWGLSILVEADSTRILLDTGAGIAAAYNAVSLGVDLSQVDSIVLSHGHTDHTGGLREVLRYMNKEVTVIAHPDAWAPKYARRKGKPDRFIGIPFQRNLLESLGARFETTSEPVFFTDHVITTGEVPMATDYEIVEPHLYVKTGTRWQKDKVLDDQALIVDTGQGLVVVLGCAHRGVINTLYRAQKLSGETRIRMVVGGCHLIDATEERLWQTIVALKELSVQKLAISHCTGMYAASVMAQEFGESFIFNNAGSVIEIE